MKIKELRTKHGLSQTELAKIANTSQRTISSYEKSIGVQNIDALIKLADYFHTTVDYLIEHKVPYLLDTSTFTQSQKEIIEKLKGLSETNCNRVNDFISGLLIAEHDKQETIKKLLGEQ